MAKKTKAKKTVVSRLKKKPGRTPTALKKPRPDRKPRGKVVKAKPKAPRKAKPTATEHFAATVNGAMKAKADSEAPRESKQDKLRAFITGDGKTLTAICDQFGWKAHSGRAALANLGKALREAEGLTIAAPQDVVKTKDEFGVITYSLPTTDAAPAAEAQ